jgi:hypothetical protein
LHDSSNVPHLGLDALGFRHKGLGAANLNPELLNHKPVLLNHKLGLQLLNHNLGGGFA